MPTTTSPVATRPARLDLRATPEQEAVLRRAAELAQKSLTDFILDSACQVTEKTLLDLRLLSWCRAASTRPCRSSSSVPSAQQRTARSGTRSRRGNAHGRDGRPSVGNSDVDLP